MKVCTQITSSPDFGGFSFYANKELGFDHREFEEFANKKISLRESMKIDEKIAQLKDNEWLHVYVK